AKLSLATIAMARYRWNHAEQKRALYTLVDPVSPPPKPRGPRLGWRRRVLPPGPIGLLRRPFIAIAGSRRQDSIKTSMDDEKRGCRSGAKDGIARARRSIGEDFQSRDALC